jgi:predicted enzyme related to lactoylglutathione lyase
MLKKVAFTMYPVSDMRRAREFYEQRLKLSPGKISVEGAWVEYDLPQGGCFALTTLAEGVSPSAIAGGSIAFEVADLDKLMSALKAEGVEVKLDIFSSPVCRMAVVLDSEGNSLILHQLNA